MSLLCRADYFQVDNDPTSILGTRRWFAPLNGSPSIAETKTVWVSEIELLHRASRARRKSLFRCRTANHLDESIGANPFRKCHANVVGAQRNIPFRGARGLVQWQVQLSTRKQTARYGILARLAERQLPQQQSFGLLKFCRRHVLFLHRH